MRILADENVAGDTVGALRQRGHEVAWVRTDYPGVPDERVLELAVAEQRIVLTFDKDFGELVFRVGLAIPPAVILIRIQTPDPETTTKTIVRILDGRDDWDGHFSVIESDRVRMTPLT